MSFEKFTDKHIPKDKLLPEATTEEILASIPPVTEGKDIWLEDIQIGDEFLRAVNDTNIDKLLREASEDYSKKLSEEVFIRLVDIGYADEVANNLNSFLVLGWKGARKLIDAGKAGIVEANLEKFKEVHESYSEIQKVDGVVEDIIRISKTKNIFGLGNILQRSTWIFSGDAKKEFENRIQDPEFRKNYH